MVCPGGGASVVPMASGLELLLAIAVHRTHQSTKVLTKLTRVRTLLLLEDFGATASRTRRTTPLNIVARNDYGVAADAESKLVFVDSLLADLDSRRLTLSRATPFSVIPSD